MKHTNYPGVKVLSIGNITDDPNNEAPKGKNVFNRAFIKKNTQLALGMRTSPSVDKNTPKLTKSKYHPGFGSNFQVDANGTVQGNQNYSSSPICRKSPNTQEFKVTNSKFKVNDLGSDSDFGTYGDSGSNGNDSIPKKNNNREYKSNVSNFANNSDNVNNFNNSNVPNTNSIGVGTINNNNRDNEKIYTLKGARKITKNNGSKTRPNSAYSSKMKVNYNKNE